MQVTVSLIHDKIWQNNVTVWNGLNCLGTIKESMIKKGLN